MLARKSPLIVSDLFKFIFQLVRVNFQCDIMLFIAVELDCHNELVSLLCSRINFQCIHKFVNF